MLRHLLDADLPLLWLLLQGGGGGQRWEPEEDRLLAHWQVRCRGTEPLAVR
jgi:hypothetical protein